ncbi:MAG: DedA family protein [Candidatus Paceibacterota bacterium]
MHIDLHALIGTYGYVAVFLGSIFDGEAVVLLSGLLSHENYLSFPWIIFWAFLGAMSNDAWWFLLGRYRGGKILESWRWFGKIMGKPVAIMGKNPTTLSFFMRFMYGFRQVIPFSIGMSNLSTRKFFLWNGLGAIIWITIFGGLGYAMGSFLETFWGRLKHFELILVITIFLTLFLINLVVRIIKNILNKIV